MITSNSDSFLLIPYSGSAALRASEKNSISRLGKILRIDISKDSKISPTARRFYSQYMRSFSESGLFSNSNKSKNIKGIVLDQILVLEGNKEMKNEFADGISKINKSFQENGYDIKVSGDFNKETNLFYIKTLVQ